jgi:integrase
MADKRTLDKTSIPGIYRRHSLTCKRRGRCSCSYVVVWKQAGVQHKQMFSKFELAREFKGDLDSGKTTRRPQSSESVGEYYETWLPNYRGRTSRGLEQSTRREYQTSFEKHILPLGISRIRLRDLAAPDLRDWFEQLESRGASPRTIHHAKIALSVMLSCAYEDGEIAANTAVGVRYIPTEAAKRRHAKPKPRALTAADIKAILNAMPEQWQAFFFLLPQTGVRVGELLGLTWQHVHLGDDPHIMVAEQVYQGRRKQLKTDASRGVVPLSTGAAAWLAELRPSDPAPDQPVFPSKAGTALTYANVYNRVLRPALVAAGIAVKVGEGENGPIYDYQGVAFHAFRHACATILHDIGKRPAQSKAWLRHRDLTTTMNTYTGLGDQGLGSADFFDDLLDVDALRSGQPRGNLGATPPPDTAANGETRGSRKAAS